MTFPQVYETYYKNIFNMVYMRLLNRDDAEDVVHEIFIHAYSAWDSYDQEKGAVLTWLYAIAKNTLINYMRKNKSFSQPVSIDDVVEPGIEDKELAALTDDNAHDAYLILKQLKDSDRELLTMRYTMNMSYREIAQEIGSNEKAVGKRMERLVSKCQTIAEKIKL